MPLHRPHEGAAGHPHRLGQAVLRPGHGRQLRGQPAHRLVVAAVYGQPPLPQQTEKRGAGRHRHPVGGPAVGLFHLMVYRRARLCGHVLVQRAPQGHVQHLDAPADAQKGQALPQRLPGEGQLHLVPLGADRAAAGQCFFAVQRGQRVGAAGQQHAVQPAAQRGQGGRASGQGQRHRQPAGPFHGPQIVRVQPTGIRFFPVRRCQPDPRPQVASPHPPIYMPAAGCCFAPIKRRAARPKTRRPS